MKKIITLFIASIFIFTTSQLLSCKKKDKDASIVGTWLPQTDNYKTIVNGNVTADTTIARKGFEFSFNLDNTYLWVDFSDTTTQQQGTYSIVGSKLYMTELGRNYASISDFSVTSNQLTIRKSDIQMSDGDTTKYEYLSLSVRK
ncbi:MAG: lipocalin family protein [Chitinophagaceae bacterium]|nr:lipocalin family protein [Chitinophagaceae bacterium]